MGKIVKKQSKESIVVSSNETVNAPHPADGSENAETVAVELRRTEIRKELSECVEEAHRTLIGRGFEKLAAGVVSLTKRAIRDRFSVCFVGEFSHGKSTLINKLIGVETLLPTNNLPTTSLLTRITAGKNESIEVLDEKGRTLQRLPLDSKSWVGLTAFDENGTASDMQNRRFVKLTVNNEWLNKAGIEIYDTPGANDGSKNRDLEISKALMIADGAVVCIDAQKGIMLSQEAFIRDRLLSPKIPFVAIAVTHLDLVDKQNRDRVIASIYAKLKDMKVMLPVIVTNDVEMPSDKFTGIVGIDKLRSLLCAWRANPERIDKVNTWVAAGTKNILEMAAQALEQKKQVLTLKGEEREKLIVEKKAAIAKLHDDWEAIQEEIDGCRGECEEEFRRRLDIERTKIVNAMINRIQSVPDPGKWYELSYKYELSTRISASIITLDNAVTENARNDLERINRELNVKYKTILVRDGKIWRHTPEPAAYAHGKSLEMKDLEKIKKRSGLYTAVAAITTAGVICPCLGACGIIGSIGISTCARFLTQRKINREVTKAREELMGYVDTDVSKILGQATKDCRARIALIYSDIKRAVLSSESKWMETQMEAVSAAAKPMLESEEKAGSQLSAAIREMEGISEKLTKFIK